MAGEVQLEPTESISGENTCSDFLAEHGEGLNHLQFVVDDIAETSRIINKEGFPTLMAGGFLDGGFTFYDTVNTLKCIWVAYQLPKTK